MELIKACFEDAILKNGYMWFFDNRIQAICRMNIANFEMEIVEEYKNKKRFYGRKIFYYHSKYYIVEKNSVNVLIYDKEDSHFNLIRNTTSSDSIVYDIYIKRERIYFFPTVMNEGVISFDVKTQKYCRSSFDEFLLKKTGENKNIQFGCACLYENKLWLPINGTRFYVKYDLIDGNSEIFQAKNRCAKILTICFDGKNIWIAQEDGSIVCNGGKKIVISEKSSYARLYNTQDFIIKSPGDTNKLILIHKADYEVVVVELPLPNIKEKKSYSWSITGFCELDDYIFLFRHGVYDLWRLNKKTLRIEAVQFQCKNYIKHCLRMGENMLIEQEDIDQESFMFFIKSNDKDSFFQEKCNVGNSVWKHMEKSL